MRVTLVVNSGLYNVGREALLLEKANINKHFRSVKRSKGYPEFIKQRNPGKKCAVLRASLQTRGLHANKFKSKRALHRSESYKCS